MHHRMLLQADCLLLQLLLFILSLSMDGLRVGTLNMNGWRDKQKRVRVAEAESTGSWRGGVH